MEDDNSDALSDVSMITTPGDYGELPDCLIVNPPDTLQEELFDASDLWNPELNTPAEVLPDIQAPQYNCASSSSASVPVATTNRIPLTDVTNTITPATLTEAAYTANRLAQDAELLATKPLMAILAGVGEVQDRKLKLKRKKGPSGVGGGGGNKRKAVLDAEGHEIVVVAEKKPRVPKKPKKGKEEKVHRSPPPAAAAGAPPPPPAAADADADPPSLADNYDTGVKGSYNPETPTVEGQHSGRERETVSPISPMIGLTQLYWPKERKNDPPPKPYRIFHSKTCRAIEVIVYGPPDPLRVSKPITTLYV